VQITAYRAGPIVNQSFARPDGVLSRTTAPCVAAGLALSLWVCFHLRTSIGLGVLVAGPWAIGVGGLLARRRSPGFAIATALMLAVELFSYVDTFVVPTSSTAGLIYVVKPVVQLAVCVPAGFIIGAVVRRARRARPGARS
jgi:hypothetical protein